MWKYSVTASTGVTRKAKMRSLMSRRASTPRIRVILATLAAVLSSVVMVVRCDMIHSERPPTDYFLVMVASLIGFAIGMSLPFFIELSRKDVLAAPGIADHTGTKKYLMHGKYSDSMVDKVVHREFVKVNCFGERFFEIPISAKTTCGDVVKELKAMLDLGTGLNEFALFIRSEARGDFRIDNEVVVHAAMIHVESGMYDRKEGRDGSDEEVSSPTKNYQFVFNTAGFASRAYLQGQPAEFSIAEEVFLFESACDQILRRRFPRAPHTLVRLAALRCQCIFGDAKPSEDIPDKPMVHPVQCDQLHNPQPPPLYEKQNTKVKRRTTKVKAPVQYRKMTKVEYDQVMTSIQTEWMKLRGVNADEARWEYMRIVEEWPYCHHQSFDVKQQCFPEWPKDLWFLVGPDSPLLLRHGRVPLVSYPYLEVHSFGAPIANRFRMEVFGKSIDFETKQVQEIAQLMKSYVFQLTEAMNDIPA